MWAPDRMDRPMTSASSSMRGVDDGLGRLPQAQIDDFHARLDQGPGDDLGPAVVAVQARLGDDDLDLVGQPWVSLLVGCSEERLLPVFAEDADQRVADLAQRGVGRARSRAGAGSGCPSRRPPSPGPRSRVADGAVVPPGLDRAQDGDLVALHGFVDLEERDLERLARVDELVDADVDLALAGQGHLVLVGGPGDLPLEEALLDRPDDAAQLVDPAEIAPRPRSSRSLVSAST